MNDHQSFLCRLQGQIFEASANRFSCSSEFFVSRFMRSSLAKRLDNPKDPYNLVSMEEGLSMLDEEYPILNQKQGVKIRPEILHWMGYITRAYVCLRPRGSGYLYKYLKAKDFIHLYDAYHTFDPDDCVGRLDELIEERQGPKLSDYEIFRRVRLGLL